MVTITSMFLAVAIVFVILGLVIIGLRTDTLLNSCWKEVEKGFDPFISPLYKSPKMVLNPECVDRMVFTASVDECKATCRSFVDEEDGNTCAQLCKIGDNIAGEDTRTFVVLMPLREKDTIGGSWRRLTDSMRNGLQSFINLKPHIVYLNCELVDMDSAISECVKEGDKWTCTPPEAKDAETKTYYIILERSEDQKTCAIKSL